MEVKDTSRRCTIPVGYVTLQMFSSSGQCGGNPVGRVRRQDCLKEGPDCSVILVRSSAKNLR